MTAAEAHSRQQARLWSAAFGLSALLNGLVLLLIVVWISFGVVIDALKFAVLTALGIPIEPFRSSYPPTVSQVEESVAMIVPELVPAAEAAAPAPVVRPQELPFARTSADQRAERPENPAFIGNQNTQATSDAPAVAGEPPMPSQRGKEPDYEGHIETTVSDYQDGALDSTVIAPPDSTPGPAAQEEVVAREGAEEMKQSQAAAGEATAATPETPAEVAPAEPKDPIAAGPDRVERPVYQEKPAEQPKPAVAERQTAAEAAKTGTPESIRQDPKPAIKSDTPGFNGYQRKTQIRGSITRQGRSALDVEDSLLGRYHAALSRAVEKEWQLNCVRNRDYITPGQIIVRFVLEPSGKVRSLAFVEEFGVGNIQKGFTSESIRTARIPAFPAELKKQLDGEPLEVTYSFTF
jgi:hypothetical protein